MTAKKIRILLGKMTKEFLAGVMKYRRERRKKFDKIVIGILGRCLVNGKYKKNGIKREIKTLSEEYYRRPYFIK